MTTTMTIDAGASCLLRTSLYANAAFSGVSGAALVAAAAPLGRLMGVSVTMVLPIVGVMLVLYAGTLWWSARRPAMNRAEARVAIAMDIAWVVASAALLLIAPGLLAPAGRWIVALVALCVAGFAILQALGLRRLDRS